MPTLQAYRALVSVEVGPYIGPGNYVVRATSGSDTLKLVCSAFPVRSGLPISTTLEDRPLLRPNAVRELDRNRYVKTYTPSTGTIEPDLEWIMPPFSPPSGNTYEFLEAFTYADLEASLYEDLEGLGEAGLGERFEVLGPFDAPTLHQLINDGLKQCWLIVEVAAIPTAGASRHDLGVIAPWLQDTTDVLQVGWLGPADDRNAFDPFEHVVQGMVERDGGRMFLNTGARTFNGDEILYLRCLKRAYDHCRPAGGEFGEQVGLELETDEAPIEADWLASSALVIAWRRFAHLLEPLANARLVRDQQIAAAWFTDRCREHFSGPLPQRTLRRRRQFGPAFRSA